MSSPASPNRESAHRLAAIAEAMTTIDGIEELTTQQASARIEAAQRALADALSSEPAQRGLPGLDPR